MNEPKVSVLKVKCPRCQRERYASDSQARKNLDDEQRDTPCTKCKRAVTELLKQYDAGKQRINF